jgi:hypothetical protein
MFVRGYPGAGYSTAAGEPTVRSVTLIPGGGGTCSDPYFFYLASGTCTLGVKADVTFSDAPTNKSSVTATISDLQTPQVYSATQNLKFLGGFWQSDGTGQGKYFDVPAQDGALNVTLTWKKTAGTYKGNPCAASSPCTQTWNNFVFQRTMSATDPSSGPIQSAVLNEGNATSFVTSPHSYVNDGASTQHTFWVNLQMQPALGYATGVNSPLVYLRVVGSQNQTIDCDPNQPNLRDELNFGCGPSYTVNKDFTCPSYAALWGTPQPWDCVKTQTGGATGQVTQGIENRMVRLSGIQCPSNNWSSFPNLSPTDPRLVSTVLTPFGTFGGSGNAIIPVTGFAEFYITGWSKLGGGSRPQPDCPGDDAPPGPGYIVGHFVHYIDTLNTGGCVSTVFGTCVVVLTQ